ncbi:putative secreted protein with PEP-CTERM sorting signal [Pseudoduganella flava]|uniref:Putative secreted protein with PEP-CTERM sorting signal n=1 Tax=Pseudoduganella flava TaxID=871742 RepID=A0A562Q6M6_9BURK|nr:NF038132 family protein [Pseudoduganella flava]QGZ41830.1 hypothetical protein GO485_24075 [Pseudoduganella flava]TWI51840.1 putative secreted protein with PEP-CTERM sorting signal [Pseudoduganella flava]
MTTSMRYVTAAALLLSGGAHAQIFDGGIPGGWQCAGSCGTAAEDGVVTLAPGGGNRYGWVSNTGGVPGVRLPGIGAPADSAAGSALRSYVFAADAGQALTFAFNYVTTDGGDFSDYGWIRLLREDGSQAALLATARTSPGGGAVPGFGMPAGVAALSPPSATVEGIVPHWSPLGADASSCYVELCGQTGWIEAAWTVAASGRYRLEFGVVNWVDNSADTGLAFDAIALDGTAPPPIPEPRAWAMLLAGLGVTAAVARRRG